MRMVHKAGAGHPGGSLSAVEMITALYFHILNVDPANPRWPDRDRFILSKGHAAAVTSLNQALLGCYEMSDIFNSAIMLVLGFFFGKKTNTENKESEGEAEM